MNDRAKTPRVVVVGAGIVGASIAFNLAERGVEVTVLDADEPGRGASRVSFAWINGRDKTPRHYHDLNRRSVDMWGRFARRLGDEGIVTWGGELRWTATDVGAGEFVSHVRELQSWGYPIRLLDAAEVSEMEPGIEAGPISAASYTACDGHVDTARAIGACLRLAKGWGARVQLGARASSLRVRGGRIEAVATEGGEVPCDIVVLATGADTPALAATAGLRALVHHTFGATIITEAAPPIFQNVAVVHTARDAPDPRLNVRQLHDGSVMVHGGSPEGSAGRSAEEVEQVLERAVQYFPALKGVGVREVRTGRRPIPDDGLPILGFARAVPNLYFATMHSGATLAALVGEFAATETVDGARIDILEPYRIERFGR